MRKLPLLLLPLLTVFALACVGSNSKLPACPTPSDVAASTFVPPPTPSKPAPEDISQTVSDGAKLLADHYVDKLDVGTLMQAAWDGTTKELQEHNITVPASIEPGNAKGANSKDRAAQLRTAFGKLPDALPADSNLDTHDLIEIALSSMADSLNDGHTTYIPARDWNDERTNRVTSIGLRLRPYSNAYIVVDVLPGSSAQAAGMKAGDVITAVNGHPTANGITDDLPPPAGVSATLTFTRQGGASQQLTMVSKPADLPPVRPQLIDGQVGLLQMYIFPSRDDCDYQSAFRGAFNSAITSLRNQGATSWLLDLRNNPGGATSVAAYVAGSLGYKGELAEIRSRGGGRDELEATGNSLIAGAPLAILVNEGSASSSEIVSSAMQDAKDAYVIGEPTAGEVAAANEFPIGDGGMEITVGRVVVGPSQKSLEKAPVKPDLTVDEDLDQLAKQGRDSQLDAAVNYLKSKTR